MADGDFEATIDDIVTDDVGLRTAEMTTAAAAELMGEHQIRRLPVVDDDENIIGIVSLGDLAVRKTATPHGRDAREHLEGDEAALDRIVRLSRRLMGGRTRRTTL